MKRVSSSAVCVCACAVLLSAGIDRPLQAATAKTVSGKATVAALLEKKWGVRIVGVRRTANDYMLDFRFRVIDPKKVGEIMDRKVRPELTVEGKGIRLNVPVTAKLGSMRQTTMLAQANRNYFMLFANPGRRVKKGDKVTIRIGKFMAEHIVVQ